MARQPETECIEGSCRLTPSIFTLTPQAATPDHSSDQTLTDTPSLILLFSWTGALPQHIAKYTTAYTSLYPSTPILVITTSIKDLIYRSSKSKQKCLAPAISFLTTQNLTSNILVHCFSEGGSHKAVQFASSFLNTTGTKLPISTLILDSTPGNPQYLMLASAFKKSLPRNAVIRFVGMLAAYSILASLWTGYLIVGPNKNIITKTRLSLDDDEMWDTNVPRCYLYSEADSLIFWKDIEDHGQAAEGRGTSVTMVKFQGSAHCRHIQENEGRYWDAVRRTWEGRGMEKEK